MIMKIPSKFIIIIIIIIIIISLFKVGITSSFYNIIKANTIQLFEFYQNKNKNESIKIN